MYILLSIINEKTSIHINVIAVLGGKDEKLVNLLQN